MSGALVERVRVRVLVAKDHVVLASRIGECLRDAEFVVDVVSDGAAALQSTTSTDYDVIVRDPPGVHGDRACCRLVRDGSPSRILLLAAAAEIEDRVESDGATVSAEKLLEHVLTRAPTGSATRLPHSP